MILLRGLLHHGAAALAQTCVTLQVEDLSIPVILAPLLRLGLEVPEVIFSLREAERDSREHGVWNSNEMAFTERPSLRNGKERKGVTCLWPYANALIF